MAKTIVDPPSGWKYGFPKELPEDAHLDSFDFRQWLLNSGYPESEVDFAMQYVRTWTQEESER